MYNIFNIFAKGNDSKQVAKDRLRLVLVNDRVNTQLIENIKYDIIKAMQNYMDIDEENFSITISQTVNKQSGIKTPVLFADFPIKKIYKS